MKKVSNKTILFIGLLFIFSAFMCIAAVFYQVVHDHQQRVNEIEEIRKDLADSKARNLAAQQKVQDIAARAGQGIDFDHLISIAEKKYGLGERYRKEGDLWIDKQGGEWMVTLGVLNGINRGSRLKVMKDKQQVGVVIAKTVLDVVSYVYPLEDKGQFLDDMYQVVMEE
jgi:hypothetical protein